MPWLTIPSKQPARRMKFRLLSMILA
ncbi:MAG: hypothetical protein JWL81_2787, partial [Verrucomicrobiales bacterium]|nr:hypothetical protein [Verrucomicrobiales bacterium]